MAYDLSPAAARNPLIAITVFGFIAVLSTYARLQSRRMRKLDLGIDDWFMVVGLILLWVSIGIQFACVINGGVGRHIEDVQPADVVKTLKLILPFEALYGITLCFIKCSVVFFYLRIFGSTPSFRISAYVAMSILIMWAMSIVLETFLLCRPLAFNWDSTIPGGVCGARNTVYVSAGSLNVVTDFMVMMLPIPHILKLHLATKRKIGLVLMFSLGVFITIISIIRIKSLQVISFTDPTFTLPMGLFWTTLEPCMAIINGNLPMVRTFLASFAPSIFGSTKDASSRTPLSGKNGSRSAPFELIDAQRRGGDVELGRMGSVARVENRTEIWTTASKGIGEDTDSEKGLTKNGIMVGRSVDVESL